jgi:phosphoglycerate dehydrogenase-like enzyme
MHRRRQGAHVTTVINLLGEQAEGTIRGASPDIEVVTLASGDPGPAGLRADVVFAAWHTHPALRRLDDLGVRWLHILGTGIDGWPHEVLTGRLVTCGRGISAIPIAEFVLGAMLAFEKDMPRVWISEPPERWNFAELGELAGGTLGLVGLGGIGVAIARRALAFDMRVRALRRNPGRDTPAGIELAMDLPDLVGTADHLVLAAPATAATRELLDGDAFARVKPGLHLVNIARGTLVDQDALRIALDDGRVAMASLDTVDPEPLPAGHWMYTHPKVRLSAHVSWASPHAFPRIIGTFVANLRRYVAGEPLEGVIDADEGY